MSHQIEGHTARELFRLADVIRQSSPWDDLNENDFFGICDPASGKVQIATFIGANEATYALQLYLPDEGLRFWNDLLETGVINPRQLLHEQRMLECEFCDTDNRPEEDIEFNNTYGSPCKEDHSLAIFRSIIPHHYPWFLDQNEALLLRNALVLADKFHREILPVLDSFYHSKPPYDLPPIPVFHLNSGADPADPSKWHVKRESFPQVPEKPQPEIPNDELFFNRFHQFQHKDAQWEIASYFFDKPLMEEDGDRPYLPYLTLCLDPTANIPPVEKFNHADKGLPTIMREAFAAAVENYAYLPDTLSVRSSLAADTFAGLEQAYGIKVVQSERLPHMDKLMPTMIKALLGELSSPRIEERLNTDGDQAALAFDDGENTVNMDSLSIPAFGPNDYSSPQSKHSYVMRVDLKASKPPIWRRITLPVDATFFDLHCAIQDAMGWKYCHLHCFDVKNKHSNIHIEIPNQFGDDWGSEPSVNECQIKLHDIVEQGHSKFNYTYDFGDDWEHSIKIEKTIETDSTQPLPTILAGKGACPPEDCGGIWGYYRLLQLDDYDLEEHGYSRKGIELIRAEKFDLKKIRFSNPRDQIKLYF